MAIGSASVTYARSTSRTAVGCFFSASGYSLPAGSSSDSVSYSYSGMTYSWSFSCGSWSGTSAGASGTIVATGLSAGASYVFRGTVTVTCTQTVTTTTTETDPETGEETSKTTTENYLYTIGTAFDTEIVWVKPNAFSYRVSQEAIIQDSLTASVWNDFVSTLNSYATWTYQTDMSTTYNNLRVSSGDIITAALYNSASSAIDTFYNMSGPSQVTKDVTIITASIINALFQALD